MSTIDTDFILSPAWIVEAQHVTHWDTVKQYRLYLLKTFSWTISNFVLLSGPLFRHIQLFSCFASLRSPPNGAPQTSICHLSPHDLQPRLRRSWEQPVPVGIFRWKDVKSWGTNAKQKGEVHPWKVFLGAVCLFWFFLGGGYSLRPKKKMIETWEHWLLLWSQYGFMIWIQIWWVPKKSRKIASEHKNSQKCVNWFHMSHVMSHMS